MMLYPAIARQLVAERQQDLLDHARRHRRARTARTARTAQSAPSARPATAARTRPNHLLGRVRAVLTSR